MGTDFEKWDLFINGLGRRLVEPYGGDVLWEGYLAEATWTIGGVAYVRSLIDMANAVKCQYTRIGYDMLLNGSAETVVSGTWTDEGSPTTNERTTDWATQGSYSVHVVTRSTENTEGVQIENGATTPTSVLTIESELAYELRMAVKIVTGTWVAKIKRTDTDATIAKTKFSGAGEQVVSVEIDAENDYEGDVRIIVIEKTTGVSGEIYIDDAHIMIAPVSVETSWYTDEVSIGEHGRKEMIFVEGEKTNAGALAFIRRELSKRAWPRTRPPDRMQTRGVRRQDGLELLFLGYANTVNWCHLTTGGEDTASNHVVALADEAEFVSAGRIETNSMTYGVEEVYKMRRWDMLEEIAEAGEESDETIRWGIGVYQDRELNYGPVDTSVKYYYRGNQIYDLLDKLEYPWKTRPGMMVVADMPVGPGEVSDNVEDDPRKVFVEVIEVEADGKINIFRERDR